MTKTRSTHLSKDAHHLIADLTARHLLADTDDLSCSVGCWHDLNRGGLSAYDDIAHDVSAPGYPFL